MAPLIRIWLALLFMLPSVLFPRQTPVVTPEQIIQAVNAVRTTRGLPALRINAILMGTAQYTADVMASSASGSHLGGIKERIIAAGYGSGFPSDSIWGTENFAVDSGSASAAQIVSSAWSDDVHMIPMTNRNYCDVGAGVSQTAGGSYYYVLQAAYNSDLPCGKTAATAAPVGKGTATITATASAPQWIVPINRSTPDAEGRIFHIVRQGQSLWYIAISYGTKIIAIQQLNGMSPDDNTLYYGEKLLIPTSLTPQFLATDLPTASATPGETGAATLLATKGVDTPAPTVSATATPDPNEQAAADERFRGGLFIALVIGIILIAAGLLINRR